MSSKLFKRWRTCLTDQMPLNSIPTGIYGGLKVLMGLKGTMARNAHQNTTAKKFKSPENPGESEFQGPVFCIPVPWNNFQPNGVVKPHGSHPRDPQPANLEVEPPRLPRPRKNG